MIYIILIAILVAIDQFLKLFMVSTLDIGHAVPLIDGVFNLLLVQNTGAAFSILQEKRLFLIAFTSAVILIIIIFILVHRRRCRRIKMPYRMMNTSLALIAAGGLGNLIDRVLNGYVVDFIQFDLISFPVFNFADCCVVIGAIFLILSVIVPSKRKDEARKNATSLKQQKNWEKEESRRIREQVKMEKKMNKRS